MTAPITDTAAVYQVHGIRFAVPDGLHPVTDRYVFTDVPAGGHLSHDPYNEITLFADARRTPEEIISDVMGGFDDLYDGPHLHNQRRTRVNGRMITQASVTYTPRSQRHPDKPEDTVRVDYAFIRDKTRGETWGFRLIPPDTSLAPDVTQDWIDMLESAEPQTDMDVPFIGTRLENGRRYFYTRRNRVAIPERWRMITDLAFAPSHDHENLSNVKEVKRCVILLRSSISSNDFERRSVGDLKQSFSRFGLSGVVEERTIAGRPVEWIEIEPRTEEGRVRTAFQDASIKIRKTGDYRHYIHLNMDVEYIVDNPTSTAPPPSFVAKMREMHESMFQSIQFSD